MNLVTIEKRIPATASFLVLIIVSASFALSYTALVSLAVDAGVPHLLAPLWPLCLDAFMAVASLVVLRRELDGQPTIWAWAVVAGITIMSVLFNVVHAPDSLISRLVYAIPPVVVFISFEMLMGLIKADIRKVRNKPVQDKIPEKKEDSRAADPPCDPVICPDRDPIVSYLHDHPGARMTEMSKALGIPRTTLTRKVQDLVKAGVLMVQDGQVRVSA